MTQLIKELKTKIFLYEMDEKKDCQYNNITFQNQLYNFYQEEIYIDNDLIGNDDRINYKYLQYNHQQASNLCCEVNKNKNNCYIPSFDTNKEKYEVSVDDPFDFKTKPKSYDDISNEEIYTVQFYLEKKKNRNEKIIGKNKNIHKEFRNDNIIRKIKIKYFILILL